MTRYKTCSQPGCPVLVVAGEGKGKCDEHRKQAQKDYDAQRGSPAERGYGNSHRAERARRLPDAYGTLCHFCNEYMYPHHELALDHTEDRTGYRGIVHLSCNARDGGRRHGGNAS